MSKNEIRGPKTPTLGLPPGGVVFRLLRAGLPCKSARSLKFVPSGDRGRRVRYGDTRGTPGVGLVDVEKQIGRAKSRDSRVTARRGGFSVAARWFAMQECPQPQIRPVWRSRATREIRRHSRHAWSRLG